MKAIYCVDRLHSTDADSIAKIERRVHEPAHCAGRAAIKAQLDETEDHGENLSLGLYYGNKLVGYLLLFVLQDRRKVCEYFDIALPAEMKPDEPVIYLADVGVLHAHRHQGRLIRTRLSTLLDARPELWDLPLEAFATQSLSTYWESRERTALSLGWKLHRKQAFNDPQLNKTMYWLSYSQCRSKPSRPSGNFNLPKMVDFVFGVDKLSVGVAKTTREWTALEPYWDKLLQENEDTTVLQSHYFSRSWWSHFEFAGSPFIVVAFRDNQPVGMTPLQIAPLRRFGSLFRCLTSICEFTTDTDFLIPKSDPDNNIKRAICKFICHEKGHWDYLSLSGKAESEFLKIMREELSISGFFNQTRLATSTPTEPPSPDHEDTGLTQVITSKTPQSALTMVEDYLKNERVHPSSYELEFYFPYWAIASFLKDLAKNCSEAFQLSVIYWRTEDRIVSACMGLIWNNMFYPLRSLPNATQRRVRKIPFDFVTDSIESASKLQTLRASHKNLQGIVLQLAYMLARSPLTKAARRLHRILFPDSIKLSKRRASHRFQLIRW